ncbi:serine/threonine-protein kinase tel1, partial [Aspergillus brasiliensis]
QSTNRVSVIQQNNRRLWEKLCTFLASREPVFIQACLITLTPLLVPNAFLPRSSPALIGALSSLVPPLANVLESCREKQKQLLLLNSEEAMDLDDPILTTYDQSTEL